MESAMRSKVTCVCCLMSVLDSIHGFLDREKPTGACCEAPR
jgi:hypothetical protein